MFSTGICKNSSDVYPTSIHEGVDAVEDVSGIINMQRVMNLYLSNLRDESV